MPSQNESENNDARINARQRLLVRAGLGIGEHVAERLADSIAERALERIARRATEHAAKRMTEHQTGGFLRGFLRMLRPAKSVKRGAKSTFKRFLEGSSEVGLQTSVAARGEQCSFITVLALKISVTLFGMVLVLHMAHKDWHRAQEELESKRPSRLAHFLFMAALLCDAMDAFVHGMVIMSLTIVHIEHDIMEQLESIGFWCAVAGTLALIVGELLSMKNRSTMKDTVIVRH